VCDRFVVMSHGQIVYDAAKPDTSMEELTRHVVLT
jgi:simple sugar transport system ATP-binding protein